MTVHLRPHHLLCILTYVGRGYSPAFTENMAGIITRIAAGEAIEILNGPDDICAPQADNEGAHCDLESVIARDRAASDDVGKLLKILIRPGTRLVLNEDTVRSLRRAFAAKSVRSACEGCEWTNLCSFVAAARFAGAQL